MNRIIWESLNHLGVGSGVDFAASGEVAVLKVLSQIAESEPDRDMCVFDVGANRGDYLNLLLRGLDKCPITVHCFEPSAPTFSLLQGRFGNASNVVLNRFGFGNIPGEFPLYSDSIGSGLASLTKRRLDHVEICFARTETVKIEILDDYCLAQEIERIDLLKLDVEGHELDVLLGGERMFRERRVRFVTFEFGGCNIDTRTYLRDYWYFFSDNGMISFYRLMPRGRLFHINSYSESLEMFGNSNYLVEMAT